jgi:predicted dehydrogenase
VDFARFGRANEPRLMVGYSRRFSPLARRCRELFDGCADPLSVTCRVNAPELPEESWIHDPELGGGRILSDVCQFVDLVCFLTGSLPRSVRAEAIPVPGSAHPNRDSVCVTLRMQNDALGVVHYLTNGDASVPRERVEVNGGGRTAILDDYRALALHEGGRRRVKKLAHQQKGFREEVAAFVAAIRGGGEMPIPFDQLLAVSRTAFLIRESLERDKVLEWTPPALRPPIL